MIPVEKYSIMICIITLLGVTATAQNKNAKAVLEVDGVCGMCKKRIETAAIKTKGVKSAVWNVETKECSLIFDERKTDITTISQRIADVGHDTKEIKAIISHTKEKRKHYQIANQEKITITSHTNEKIY